jgi:hypothetical protein
MYVGAIGALSAIVEGLDIEISHGHTAANRMQKINSHYIQDPHRGTYASARTGAIPVYKW